MYLLPSCDGAVMIPSGYICYCLKYESVNKNIIHGMWICASDMWIRATTIRRISDESIASA